MTYPETHKAYVIKGNKAEVTTIPVPKLQAGEILIKNEAVAINPTDWKHIAYGLGVDGAVVGCDFAGKVVAVADDVTTYKVDDDVAGIVGGASAIDPENGAFAEYTVSPAIGVYKPAAKLTHAKSVEIPSGPIETYEAAASIGVGLSTTLIGFGYYSKIPVKANPAYKDQVLLVWGGASSLGQFVIQIGRIVGFKIIATASKHNFEQLKALGADEVVDYHDADVLDQIKAYAGDKITLAYDTITAGPTTESVYSVMSKSQDSVLLTSLTWDDKTAKEHNPKVAVRFPLAYLALKPVKKFGAAGAEIHSPPGLIDESIKLIAGANELFAKNDKALVNMPVRVSGHGLESLDDALEIVKTGKNSGVKIVVRLD